MYSIGPLRPTLPPIEFHAGAFTTIPLPLTRGQTVAATTTFLTIATSALAVGPHFINVALSPDSVELERVRIKNLITKVGRRANSLELAKTTQTNLLAYRTSPTGLVLIFFKKIRTSQNKKGGIFLMKFSNIMEEIKNKEENKEKIV